MPSFGSFQFELGGGYSYSNVQFNPHNSTGFTMISDSGYFGEAELGLGTKHFQIFADGHLSAEKYVAPTSRTLLNPSINSTEVSAGLRVLSQNFGWFAKWMKRDSVLVEGLGNNTYHLSLTAPQMVVSGLQFSAREKLMSISIDLEAGFPLEPGKSDTSSGQIETALSRFVGADAKINIGNVWRLSLYGGVRSISYKSNDHYTNLDIFAGAIITYAFSFSRGGSSAGDDIPYNYTGSQYPFK